jgi:phospholipid/cholesterol/gamma-HCH transport system substrate-binding protein
MAFQVGAFRFDRHQYFGYTMYFKDISGLTRKAEVKIAGVKVGWVEGLDLISDGGGMRAKARVMIHKNYKLYSNAYAIIRQEGLLGPKFLEVIPGDPLLDRLSAGATLSQPSAAPVSMDEVLRKFKEIADNVEDVTASIKGAIGGAEGGQQLQNIFKNIEVASEKIASIADIMDRTVLRNEENIDTFLGIGNDIKRLSNRLESEILPTLKNSFERVSDVFDKNFCTIADKLGSTVESIDDTVIQAREGIRNISSVAEKIDQGKGLLGKLINEDETYRDLKVATNGLKNYVARMDRLQLVFDSHFETMYRPGEHYKYEDGKGYCDIRVHPNEDHFYLVQLATSDKGRVVREEKWSDYFNRQQHWDETPDRDPRWVKPNDLTQYTHDNVYDERKIKIKRNTVRFGLQFGKNFDNIGLRFGLFEGSAGVGVDFDIPFNTEKFRWVTSIEAFDMSGQNRVDDRRPHLKWINKVYMFRNIYMTFGADDFVSFENANAFFGAGIRFGDDDVKYLMSSAGSGLSAITK